MRVIYVYTKWGTTAACRQRTSSTTDVVDNTQLYFTYHPCSQARFLTAVRQKKKAKNKNEKFSGLSTDMSAKRPVKEATIFLCDTASVGEYKLLKRHQATEVCFDPDVRRFTISSSGRSIFSINITSLSSLFLIETHTSRPFQYSVSQTMWYTPGIQRVQHLDQCMHPIL